MRIDALEIRAQGTAQGEFAHDHLLTGNVGVPGTGLSYRKRLEGFGWYGIHRAISDY